MDKYLKYLMEMLKAVKWDREKLAQELRELAYFINRQAFNKIPGLSAVTGLLAGAWVASTFTTSPVRGVLADWGLMKGGTHVVSTRTYGILSFFLPVIAVGFTAYAVNKGLKLLRERQLASNMAIVARMAKEDQTRLRDKLDLLEKARVMGIVSEGEYQTKRADLYRSFARTPSRVEEIIIRKLAS